MPSSGRDVIGDGKPQQLAINGPAARFMHFRGSWPQTGLVSGSATDQWRSLFHHIPMNRYQYLRSCDMFAPMNFWSTISRLLLVLALFGLAAGPMVASPSAPAMAAQAMASMPGGMPCCPDGKPMVPDCAKTCPLAVVCAPGVVANAAAEAGPVTYRIPVGEKLPNRNHLALASLLGEPPPRPPKA